MGKEHATPMDQNSGDEKKDMMQIDRPQKIKDLNPFNTDYLRIYYSRLFPYADFFKWLSYGNDSKHPGCDPSFIGRREFSFTLEQDIYIRYLSFHDVTEMEVTIRDKCPFKIDIGAIYNVDPAKRTAYSNTSSEKVFAPVERELVFDVDMTDYDDIRFCCSGADVCLDCWPLMTVAIKVVDTALREDFGFEHILWVYSGRRGVHCWVCDFRARRLNNEQRASIADYFRVYKGSENNNKKVFLGGAALHPSLSRAYVDVLKPLFEEEILLKQNLLQYEDRYERLLEMIPDDGIVAQARDRFESNRRGSSDSNINVARWKQLKQLIESGRQHKGATHRKSLEEIIFTYTYPRLDLEVSKHMNHLLKAPFCVHPKTGRVCVPINPMDCENFNPTLAPTIADLVEDLNRGDSMEESMLNHWDRDVMKTSLMSYINEFRSSFLNPLLKTCKIELERAYNERIQKSASNNVLDW